MADRALINKALRAAREAAKDASTLTDARARDLLGRIILATRELSVELNAGAR